MQRRLIQTKVYYQFSHSISKETNHKTLKVAATKTFISGVYAIGTTFLFHMRTGRHCFYTSLPFFKVHYNMTVLISKVQNKVFLYYAFQNFI